MEYKNESSRIFYEAFEKIAEKEGSCRSVVVKTGEREQNFYSQKRTGHVGDTSLSRFVKTYPSNEGIRNAAKRRVEEHAAFLGMKIRIP